MHTREPISRNLKYGISQRRKIIMDNIMMSMKPFQQKNKISS